ncbi:ElyC/SanA/YdcF family protein [Thermophilibacter immobilis]|uniref:YdcF family protein n=1 Tax=Thermophilibacter immobilis TaxID=2779519 RepID=A0A7S7M8N9_9ACTN|nr:ElyC/SanA/YdcF family protein [Thermophilibacter immobilis]QOY60801.1 YdcF family protein [Thermophilibacter immobilis]
MGPAETARNLNTLAAFTGMRDVASLDRCTLEAAGVPDGQVDVAILTGGTIPSGADVMAEAMQAHVARTYALVGGTGHTTATFRARARELWEPLDFSDDASEAEIFDAYLRTRHGLAADLLETRSTNSGENIAFLFKLLRARGLEPTSVLLIQDATLQRRLDATLRLQEPQVRVVNYAAYQTRLVVWGDATAFAPEPLGMWEPERYRTLLMGEMSRLIDTPGGYGPLGANFIAHVDVPDRACQAFERLRAAFPDSARDLTRTQA